jgi:hypothetical protein
MSTLEGTRTGKNICSDSSAKDKDAANKVVTTTAGQWGRMRRKLKASKKPNGA